MKLMVIGHSAFMRVNRILFREIAETGTDTTVLSPGKWRCDFKTDEINLEPREGEKFALVSGKTAFNGKINYYFFTSPLLLGMQKIRPDIVFIYQEPWSFSALQGAVVSRLFGAEPVIYTMENIERKLRFPLPLIEKAVFRLCKNGFALNDEAVELLKKKGFGGRVQKLYLGVDTKVFRKRDAGALRRKLGLNGFVIGYMGRLIKEKGVETLLDACAGLKFEFSIVIDCGEFFGEQRRVLEERAEGLGLRERLVFVNPEYGEMPLYMSALDVLVLPSRTSAQWKEQFGRVLAEAMACGTPVIGSSSGAIPEIIGDAGLVFREGGHKELAGMIAEIKNKKALRERLIEKGLRRAKEVFEWRVIAGGALELLGKMMEERAQAKKPKTAVSS